ncbi:DUF6257 family protein [Actinacidiphila glaucinigra]|uniref:DUF6257 family protein n=1 Tax=Actinacidiphila glaucinigra TaxID=235986 RepID=UPI0029A91B88|nr:DUF6257 family protein [Actinacidiphila glaucinigra]MDX3235670.1 DUF6257 family protein [Streptomyces sp. ME03-5709C]
MDLNNDPPLTIGEAAEIARITAVACMRGGFTTRQEKKIDRIIDDAKKRAEQAK